MTESKYKDLEFCIEYIENLISTEIQEIKKLSNAFYHLLINNVWYSIKYDKIIGTDFFRGKCLELCTSSDRKNWIPIFCNQTFNDSPRLIISKLNDIYISIISIDLPIAKSISNNVLEFINEIDEIDIYNENIFIVTKANNKFYYKFDTSINSDYVSRKLYISKFDGQITKSINNEISTLEIDNIYNFLHTAYLMSKKYRSTDPLKILMRSINSK
jgi:hypothetical protein